MSQANFDTSNSRTLPALVKSTLDKKECRKSTNKKFHFGAGVIFKTIWRFVFCSQKGIGNWATIDEE